MKYILLGDECKRLFIEDDEQQISFRYDPKKGEWVFGGSVLNDNRHGFDASEPEGSFFRSGNSGVMEPMKEITKEEAEAFLSMPIDGEALQKKLDEFLSF